MNLTLEVLFQPQPKIFLSNSKSKFSKLLGTSTFCATINCTCIESPASLKRCNDNWVCAVHPFEHNLKDTNSSALGWRWLKGKRTRPNTDLIQRDQIQINKLRAVNPSLYILQVQLGTMVWWFDICQKSLTSTHPLLLLKRGQFLVYKVLITLSSEPLDYCTASALKTLAQRDTRAQFCPNKNQTHHLVVSQAKEWDFKCISGGNGETHIGGKTITQILSLWSETSLGCHADFT